MGGGYLRASAAGMSSGARRATAHRTQSPSASGRLAAPTQAQKGQQTALGIAGARSLPPGNFPDSAWPQQGGRAPDISGGKPKVPASPRARQSVTTTASRVFT